MKKPVDIIFCGCYSVRCIIENGRMPFWGLLLIEVHSPILRRSSGILNSGIRSAGTRIVRMSV